MMLIALAVLQAAPAAEAAAAPPTPLVSPSFLIPQDTPVELMAPTEVSTDKAWPGMVFKLRVNKPVIVAGRTVVPVGTPAFGQVVSASDAGGLGKSGRMTAKLVAINLGDVEIPITGDIGAKGQGAGSAAVAVALAGVVGLFHRGNNAKIKAGEIVAGYVAEPVTLDLSGPKPQRVTPAAPATPPVTPPAAPAEAAPAPATPGR